MRYSVAIPAFDAADTLPAVLRGVRSLHWKPSEVVVVDDGSRDATAEVAEAAGARVVRHGSRRGLAGARNTALAEIADPFVLWFDADFVPEPQVPEVLWEGFDGDEVAAVGGRAREVAGSRADLWRRVHAPQDHGGRPRGSVWMVMGLCVMHRVDALRGVGGFDERFLSCAEDVEMSLRLRRSGFRLAYRPAAVGEHLRHDDNDRVVARMQEYVRQTSLALMLHGTRPRRWFAPILLKQLITHPLGDVIHGRFDLIPLDLRVWRARCRALRSLDWPSDTP
ncbi:glycosyltransferase family 2 protein [Candidatus Fermentibacteria bacterium]|nr:glycosyltransferase family 2 protein [Candidatus Fermentibacteria bacterium]